MFKSLIGAAVIAADIFAGMAYRGAFKTLHEEVSRHAPGASSHLDGAYALYGLLVILTLWVIASVAQTTSAKPVAPQRAAYRSGSSQGRGR